VQRVLEAKVDVGGKEVARAGKGLMALAAFSSTDDSSSIKFIIDKIINLRVFEDTEGKLNLSLNDIDGSLLIVPNFTVYGDARKGRRPSFIMSAKPDEARGLFEETMAIAKNAFEKTQFGVFQADMKVYLINDGPVTILLDSDKII
jgi:D-tyrosyl-tRNA(Tyr) deacylase